MGKRGRPPKVRGPEDYTHNANSTGQSVEDKNLMKVEDAAHLTHKNARTMMKVMQLLDLMNNDGAEDLDTNRLVQAKIDKYKKRINRRLRKLAEWSDEKVEDRRLFQTDRRKKYESEFKQVYTITPKLELRSYNPVYNYEGNPTDQNQSTTQISYGSVANYTQEYNKLLTHHGEATYRGAAPSGNSQTSFRTSEYVPVAGEAPAVSPNDPFIRDKQGKGAPNVKNEGLPNLYEYITDTEIRDLSEEGARKRRKLDNAHRRQMKELFNKLTGKKPPIFPKPGSTPSASSSSK